MKITVLGDGGWGTALACHLHHRGRRVAWWGAFPDYLRELDRRRRNRKYLPGIPIPRSLRIVPELEEAVQDAGLVILAVPSQHVRAVVRRLAPLRSAYPGAIFLSVSKGVERRSLKRMSEVIAEELGRVPFAVLSGPSIASEVAKGQPASLV